MPSAQEVSVLGENLGSVNVRPVRFYKGDEKMRTIIAGAQVSSRRKYKSDGA